jgi:hypothetical protein
VHRRIVLFLAILTSLFFIAFVCYNICFQQKLNIIQDNINRCASCHLYNETEITQLKKEQLVLQENINSLNTRFNDLYLLGATIVILLLAITVSAYLKIEAEVGKHMKDKERQIEKEMVKNKAIVEKHIEEIASILSDVKISAAAIEELKNRQTNQQPPQQT